MNQKTIQTIQRVAKRLSKKYAFGYYDREDIEQECFLLAQEALDKFDSERGNLENFLYVHLSNRLKDFLRNNYYRRDFVCKKCGGEDPHCDSCQRRRWRFLQKKNLVEPIDIDHVNCNNESNAYTTYNLLEQVELEEIFGLINRYLEIELRIDYLKILEGMHVPKHKREIIEARIIEILDEHGYDIPK